MFPVVKKAMLWGLSLTQGHSPLFPFLVLPKSTYVNLRLTDSQVSFLTDYIRQYTTRLVPTALSLTAESANSPAHYLSVNIYNCTSPLFFHRPITRCEINTYVRHTETGEVGTMILDYSSNGISMDPVDAVRWPTPGTRFWENAGSSIEAAAKDEFGDMDFRLNIGEPMSQGPGRSHMNGRAPPLVPYDPSFQGEGKGGLTRDIVRFTDTIYYKNGGCDKLYYDSSLVQAEIVRVENWQEGFRFQYKGMNFGVNQVEEVFYFRNPISFICHVDKGV